MPSIVSAAAAALCCAALHLHIVLHPPRDGPGGVLLCLHTGFGVQQHTDVSCKLQHGVLSHGNCCQRQIHLHVYV